MAGRHTGKYANDVKAMAVDRVILIAGPTASGKSALALALAERVGGVIVNADSMQVYQDLAILTARPEPADMARVPHALYGVVPLDEAYSVGRYVVDAAAAIAEARRQGRIPIVTGGTGLYFKALLDGLSPIPEIPADIRQHWRDEAARQGAAALWERLATSDPAAAAVLRPTDSQRLVRALEVKTATGRSILDWQREPGRPVIDGQRALKLLVARPRDDLFRRADQRFKAMIAAGALDEVGRLHAARLDPGLPAMRALGVRPLLAHLAGNMTLDAAIDAAQQETRAYIKRQITWSKRHMMSWTQTEMN